jgi:starch synthase (maltosyl-transferring)
MFQIRAVLATTLSSVYGIYSGFELCENAALPGAKSISRQRNISSRSATGTLPATSKN